MSKSVESLQEKLELILGSRNVYFQPPEDIRLKYPCIIYDLSTPDQIYANNRTYLYTRHYSVTYIRKDADIEDFPERFVHSFPLCREGRTFKVDNLYHTIFDLYY